MSPEKKPWLPPLPMSRPEASSPNPPAPPPAPISPQLKRRHFLIGLVGWYLINGLLWFAVAGGHFSSTDGSAPFLNLFVFPLNLGLLIVLAIIRRTRWVALGILGALATNFVVALLVGLVFNGICFVPFWFNTGA